MSNPTLNQDLQLIDLYLSELNTEDQKSRLRGLEWSLELLKTHAKENKIAPYLYLQFKRLGSDLQKEFQVQYEEILRINTDRVQVGLLILKDLKGRGVDVIILKGNAIAEEIYGDIGYKQMNDIDILVQKKDLDLVLEVFKSRGLLTAGALNEEFRQQENYSHHWPPFFTKDFKCFFGTHWDLVTPTRGFAIPIDQLWEKKEEFKFYGETCYRLAPEHFLMHLCIHLSPVKTGMKEIGDLVKYVQFHERRLSSERFFALVSEAGVIDECFEALFLAHALSNTEFTKAVLERLAVLADTDHKLESILRAIPKNKILYVRTSYVSKIEKCYALFMMTESPLEKTALLAKMWRMYLLVPWAEALKLSRVMPSEPLISQIGAYLKAPWKVSQVFIRDLGLIVFLVVTARHQWIWVKSFFQYLRKKVSGEKVLGLKQIAEAMGLDLKKIQEISALD